MVWTLVAGIAACLLFRYGNGSIVEVGDNGGYRKIVVAVSPDLKNAEAVIKRFQSLLHQTSQSLHVSTRQRFYFQEVIFFLPEQFLSSSFLALEDRRRSYVHPDILLMDDNANDSFTVQPDGCGRPGLRIYVPASFVTRNMAHKAFLHEWAHYRYGVFDEHGFPDNPVYPIKYQIPGMDNRAPLSVTSCTNEKAVYTLLNSSGFPCNGSDDDCLPIFEDSKNPNVVSSLMDQRFSSKVSFFCDGKLYPHDKEAPSMQNALCRQKSVWQVLSKNNDFQSRPPVELMRTSFRYVIESSPRLVVAIEATTNLAKNKRIDAVKNAFSFFVMFDLPRSSKVWLVNLRRLGPPYHVTNTRSSFESILEFFPEAYGNAKACIHCGINEAIKILRDDATVHADGSILLVTTVDIEEEQFEAVARNLRDNDAKLFVVFFGDPASLPPILQELSERSGGRLFFILEDSKPKDQMLVPLTQLYESFRFIYESFSWRNKNRVLVDQRVFYEDTEAGSLSFTIDSSIESFQVIVTGPDFLSGPPVLRDELFLKYQDEAHEAQFSYRMKIPAYILTVPQSKTGQWQLLFRRKKENDRPIVIIVRAFSDDFKNIVHLRSWISANQAELTKPWTLYAEIRRGHNPVGNVNVTAILHHHSTGSQISFRILDSGEGNPDIRRYDGIYTRGLTGSLLNGFYTLTVVATKNAASSQNKSRGFGMSLADVSEFSRVMTSDSFYFMSEDDQFAPRRIVDLYVANVETLKYGIRHYTLKWTAPGDQYDSGQANKYEMKVFRDRDDAINNFDTKHLLTISEWETHGPWLQPQASGTVQSLIIQLNLTTGIYYLVMRAVNHRGNKADVSNVVRLYFQEPLLTTPSSFSTTSDSTLNERNETAQPSNDFETQNAGSNNLNLVIGVTCGLLLLLILVASILLVYLSKKKRYQKPKKDTISPPYFPRKNSEINNAIFNSSMRNLPSIPVENPAFVADHQRKTNNFVIPTISRKLSDNYSMASINDSIIFSTMRSVHSQGSVLDVNEFYEVPLHEERNLPFNPIYTSSLRRMSSQRSSQTYRLGTDV